MPPSPSLPTAYDATLAGLDPMCWWTLNEPTEPERVVDSSANGWSGTVHGRVDFGERGPIDGHPEWTAAVFDGNTGFIDTEAPPPRGAFSIVAWANFIERQYSFPDQYPYIAACMADDRRNGVGLGIGFQENYGPINNIFFVVGTGSGQAEIDWYGIQERAGWHFIAGTWDGSEALRLFCDAVNVGSETLRSMEIGRLPWAVGANNGYGEGFDDFWPSGLAGVAIFDYELSAEQISALYESAEAGGR